MLGPSIAGITTGGFVVEIIFAIPGLGRYFVQAVQQLDYTVIMGTTVFFGAFLVFMVILVDIIYGYVDPRVRLGVSTMTEQTLAPGAFEKIEQTEQIHGISRPSLSYWQDAWIRLKANRRALYSLYLVVGLLLFTFIGPVLWQIDPSVQDVDQISQPPFANRTVQLVPEYEPWYPSSELSSPGLNFVQPPTTQYVRLTWDKKPGRDRWLPGLQEPVPYRS